LTNEGIQINKDMKPTVSKKEKKPQAPRFLTISKRVTYQVNEDETFTGEDEPIAEYKVEQPK
jgi:hypothetical protein